MLWLGLTSAVVTLTICVYLGYRVVTVYPPSEIGIIGVETTATERIVHFQQDANTLYWCDKASVWPGQRSIVTLHRVSWRSTAAQFADRFAVPLDCEQVLLFGALGDGYLLQLDQYEELVAEESGTDQPEQVDADSQ